MGEHAGHGRPRSLPRSGPGRCRSAVPGTGPGRSGPSCGRPAPRWSRFRSQAAVEPTSWSRSAPAAPRASTPASSLSQWPSRRSTSRRSSRTRSARTLSARPSRSWAATPSTASASAASPSPGRVDPTVGRKCVRSMVATYQPHPNATTKTRSEDNSLPLAPEGLATYGMGVDPPRPPCQASAWSPSTPSDCAGSCVGQAPGPLGRGTGTQGAGARLSTGNRSVKNSLVHWRARFPIVPLTRNQKGVPHDPARAGAGDPHRAGGVRGRVGRVRVPMERAGRAGRTGGAPGWLGRVPPTWTPSATSCWSGPPAGSPRRRSAGSATRPGWPRSAPCAPGRCRRPAGGAATRSCRWRRWPSTPTPTPAPPAVPAASWPPCCPRARSCPGPGPSSAGSSRAAS